MQSKRRDFQTSFEKKNPNIQLYSAKKRHTLDRFKIIGKTEL